MSGFCHEALFYADDTEYVAGTVPAIRSLLASGGAALVAVGPDKTQLLMDALEDDSARVRFADMEQLGRNPGRIIGAWMAFAREHAGRPLVGVGEPAWPGRSADELRECFHHESLLNVAFAGAPAFRLVCPYDIAGLDPAVVAGARRTHPHLVSCGAHETSDAYDPEPRPLDDPLSPPDEPPAEVSFTSHELRALRAYVGGCARDAGLDEQRTADLVVAINELATNSLRHAHGRGTLRTWIDETALVCEIEDDGRLLDPLAGRDRPQDDSAGGRGLWIVNQLCDLVQIRSTARGTLVRLHMRHVSVHA